MSSNTKSKYSSVDLFAGAGGLSYGFLQTVKFYIKVAFENNLNAQKTYKRNHGNVEVYDDSFVFCGTKDSQYQQIGNAVPPMLSKAPAEHICDYLVKG